VLVGYSGIVQCDGYAAYKQFADPARGIGAVILAFCWAHGRRRFYEIAKAGSAPIAEEALRRIAALYAIEAQIRGRSAEESRAARQAESNPWSRISRGGWKPGSRAPPTNRPLPWRSAAAATTGRAQALSR
jgi:hypothetical protein